ncbi:acetyltransferase [Pseudomonas huanghezhanensis]|uniref:acetyltransferase n=1 Tax=Pseudomonas huanghezhanensis TaxID=3002903 RepID=UPI00228582B0|nr:acetyltransferase [Pseudomonas sp. BSw22131]
MNVKKLIIVGAGGLGREVHSWCKDWLKHNPGYVLGGFIDDGGLSLNRFSHYADVVSTIEGYQPAPDELLICAIGKPADKKYVVNKLLAKGAEFFTLIHPTAILGENVQIGRGTLICPYSVLSVDLTVGEFVTVNTLCTISHDTSIGDFTTLSLHCDVTGGVVLEGEVFMGSRASVLPKVRVGKGAVVGAGSVVLRDVKAGSVVVGVPARYISE